MISKEENLLKRQQMGGKAFIAYQHVEEILLTLESNTISEIKRGFVSGKPSNELLNAKLVVIDEIRSTLKRQIDLGNSARETMAKERDHG